MTKRKADVVDDYFKAQRAIDVLGMAIERRKVYGMENDFLRISSQTVKDTQALIRIFCLMRQQSFAQWLKVPTKKKRRKA